MRKTIYFIVSGHVQGVFFRASTRQQAGKLGITGWVRNLPDGRVEGVACGADIELTAFRQWLVKGPELARVEEVKIEELELREFPDFTVRVT